MKKLLIALLLSLSIAPSAQASPYNEPHSMQAQLENARSKTVRVVLANVDHYAWMRTYSLVSAATGTMIGDGYILTNYHVINFHHNRLDVVTYDGTVYTAEIIKSDKSKDLALLQFDSDAEGFTLSDTEPYPGMDVMTVGQPAGLPQWSFSEGTVQTPYLTYTDTGGSTQAGIYTNADVIGGASGGPLINDSGELIGVIRAGGNGTSYAIPLDVIKNFLEDDVYEH